MLSSPALSLAFAILLLVSCNRQTNSANPRHLVQTLSYWNFAEKASNVRPLQSGPIPAAVEDFMRQQNRRDGIELVTKGYSAPMSFAADVSAAIVSLPQIAKSLLEKRVVGIFYARDLGSSGFSEYIYDELGKPVAAFIVLDLDVLNKRANDWLTYKENLPFEGVGTFNLVGMIEGGEANNRCMAIQFLLLHELGHVAQINPSKSEKAFRIYSDDWFLNSERKFESNYDAAFPQRSAIAYYGGAKRTQALSAKSAYEFLRRTPFATMYGATSAGEDFAETFALYNHTVLMGKPYILQMYENNKLVAEYNIQDEMKRLEPRFNKMADLLNKPN